MRRILTLLTLALCFAVAPVAAQGPATKAPKAPAQRNSPMRISGQATTLASCTAGLAHNVHTLGWAPRGTRIVVDMEGDDDFDGIATALVVQMGPEAGDNARVQFAYSDDADGADPRLDINLENDANVIVVVGNYGGSPGCYFLKVDVRLP